MPHRRLKQLVPAIEIQGFIIDPNLSKKSNKQQPIANYIEERGSGDEARGAGIWERVKKNKLNFGSFLPEPRPSNPATRTLTSLFLTVFYTFYIFFPVCFKVEVIKISSLR